LAKSSQKNRRAKKCQNIYIKLKANFKVRNTYYKAILKTQNTYNKPGFKTAYLGENRRICSTQKVAQNIAIFLGYFFQKKNRRGRQKVAQMAKFRRIKKFGYKLRNNRDPKIWDGQIFVQN
jgi:hypothetical protein